jgi:hypothetical protein
MSSGLLHPQIDVEDRDPAIKERIMAGQYQPQPFPPKPLHAMEKISVVWPGPPPHDHLHVFIALLTGLSPAIAKTAGELCLCAGSRCLTNADL